MRQLKPGDRGGAPGFKTPSAQGADGAVRACVKIAEKVQKEVKAAGGVSKITTKYTTSNKETRIIVASPWVKEHVLFKDNTVIKSNKEYRKMLNFLCGYTMAGKNKHDDVPDAWSLFADYIQALEGNKVTVFQRPF